MRRFDGMDDPRQLLEALFESSPFAFQVYRSDGHSLGVNKAFVALFGSEPPPGYNIFADEIAAKQGITALIRRAFAGETITVPPFWYDPRNLEHVDVKEGRRVGIELTLIPLLDPEGKVSHVANCVRDVTVEMERQQEHDYLKALQECSVEITSVHRADTKEPLVSPAVLRILGWTEAEFARRGRELIHPEDLARFDADELHRSPGVPMQTEYRMQHHDGSWRWMSVTSINLLAHPTIAGIVSHHHDITDLKTTTAALQRREEELSATLDSIGDGVIATDGQGRVTRMNPVAEKLTGWPADQAKGRHLDEIFRILHETTKKTMESPVDVVLREGVVVGLANHTVLVARDGTEKAIATSGAPIRDPQGRTHGVVLVVRDQVEERKAELALQHSEARFRRLSEAGILGIVMANTSGVISEANDAFLALVGYSQDDLAAGRISGTNLNTPDRDKTDSRARVELRTRGHTTPWEKELVHKDGRRIPVLMGVAMLDEGSGASVAFVLDLTEAKRIDRALRESEARKTAVMDAALDAIVLMDHEGLITEFNDAAERTFGYSRDEVIGKPLHEILIPPSFRERHIRGLAHYLKTGEGKVIGKRLELVAMRKDGTEFPAEVAVVRIRSEGTPVFTGYIRDITERRHAAEAEMLRREKDAAEEANAELEAFSYSVAHDLRAPLRAINGFASVLREDLPELDEASKQHLGRISAGADRMSHIIDALLSLARLTRAEVRREPVDLAKLAHAIIARFRASDPNPARDVTFVAPASLLVQGDAELIGLLLENLLGNAWKFTGKVERAQIELGHDDAGYFVRDNGAGFDMTLVNKLFAPFRRLHKESEFEGTGVGLATVQRIVRRHGGQVSAESVENQGSTFRFTLAAADPRKAGV